MHRNGPLPQVHCRVHDTSVALHIILRAPLWPSHPFGRAQVSVGVDGCELRSNE